MKFLLPLLLLSLSHALPGTVTKDTHVDKRQTVSAITATCIRLAADANVNTGVGTANIALQAGACVCEETLTTVLPTGSTEIVYINGQAFTGADAAAFIASLDTNVAALTNAQICSVVGIALFQNSMFTLPATGSCCARACDTGFVDCNGQCYDPTTSTCQSGIVVANPARRKRRDLLCPMDQVKCPMGRNRFECVDTQSDIESCGGCVYSLAQEGVDCTAIANTDNVVCLKGECEIKTCRKGYVLGNNGTSCDLDPRKVKGQYVFGSK